MPLEFVVPEETEEVEPLPGWIAVTVIVSPSGSLSLDTTSPVTPDDPSDAVTVASSLTELVLFVATGGLFPSPPTTVIVTVAVVVAVPSERV